MKYPPTMDTSTYTHLKIGIRRSCSGAGYMYIDIDRKQVQDRKLSTESMRELSNMLSVAYESLMMDGETHSSEALDFLWDLRNVVSGDEIQEKR